MNNDSKLLAEAYRELSGPYSDPNGLRTVEKPTGDFRTRDQIIDEIESYVGTLSSVPWHAVSTEDLHKLCGAVREIPFDKTGLSSRER